MVRRYLSSFCCIGTKETLLPGLSLYIPAFGYVFTSLVLKTFFTDTALVLQEDKRGFRFHLPTPSRLD